MEKWHRIFVGLVIAMITGSAYAVQGQQGDALTYDNARWDPIHFKPAIEQATDEQCLACHQEVLDRQVWEMAPSGLKAADTLAWYQTMDTYQGEQDTFHRRHLVTPMAQDLMQLRCNTCHEGNDPRDEVSGTSATTQAGLTMRKSVNPETCLMCHGKMDHEVMGLPGPWEETAKVFQNNCLTCHSNIRTVRHQVNFLKPEAIEAAGKQSGDVCYGCHGGRAWYRIVYPYPRHVWSEGAPVPEKLKNRPTESQPRFLK